ncbi:protein FAR1-RELATED SEQUENCE 5-like [Silene latifolia]|uniref:protein FAR1-RELATED SEQUENCE 5-like n=1 Tax=Silene latifolia TaxID=37657 RepID=UPI003D7793D0
MRLRSCPKTDERPAGYIVDQFREVNNHPLYPVKNREFQKLLRDIHDYIKRIIIDHTKLNIGPTLSYIILKEYSNGYHNLGASLIDFKNIKRDVKCYIGDNDASMFIGNFKRLAETQGFYFAYDLNGSTCLTKVFWADQEAINNYKIFGETISFDPTYGTNKYFMVFTPFTGVVHNKKTVTFGVGLLEFESQESFEWIFRKVFDAMGLKQPQCIITYQCPGIKKACPNIFTNAIHK